jgi:hypothetical protein
MLVDQLHEAGMSKRAQVRSGKCFSTIIVLSFVFRLTQLSFYTGKPGRPRQAVTSAAVHVSTPSKRKYVGSIGSSVRLDKSLDHFVVNDKKKRRCRICSSQVKYRCAGCSVAIGSSIHLCPINIEKNKHCWSYFHKTEDLEAVLSKHKHKTNQGPKKRRKHKK